MAEVKCYTLATGVIDPMRKASRDAVKFMKKQPGFVGIHIPQGYENRGTLWLYDTREHAEQARRAGERKGIEFGTNICEIFVDEIYVKKGGSGGDKAN